MITVFIRCQKKCPSDSWEKIKDFKNIKEAKIFCEAISKIDDVINVELSLFERVKKTYKEYLKEKFEDSKNV